MRLLCFLMMNIFMLSLTVISPVQAGPQDKSKFRDSPYSPHKTVYDFNYAKPGQGLRAFGYIKNHLRALEEFGDVADKSHIIIVSHGNEIHSFARENALEFPDAYARLKELTDKGVEIFVCRNSARGKGYDVDDFYDLVTLVPAGAAEIAHWQMKGYTTMYPALHPRVTKDDLQ